VKRVGIVAVAVMLAAGAAWVLLRHDEPVDVSTAEERPTAQQAPVPEHMNAVLSAPLKAQTGHGSISGSVTHDGQGVAGATVTATRAEGDETLSDLDCQCDNQCGRKLLECGCPEASEQLKTRVVERRGEVMPVARAVTRADGTFELTGLDDATVSLWADDAKLGTAFQGGVAVGTQDAALELGEGITVSGNVVIDDTRPASGAWVTLIHAGHSRFFDTLADADGRFRVGPLPKATYALVAGSSAGLPDHLQITKTYDDLTLRLFTPRKITGTVEQGGKPAPQATIHLDGNHRKRDVTTNGTGAFTFDELRPGVYALTASSGDSRARASVEVPAKGNPSPVRLVLEAGAVVSGRVHSKGHGLEGARVAAGLVPDWVEMNTDSGGRYRLVAKPGESVGLFASLKGYADQSQLVNLKPGEQTFDIELEPQALIEGTVLHAKTGAPVAGVKVEAVADEKDEDPDAEATTDERGAFALEALGPGHYFLSAKHDEFITTRLEVDAPASRVRVSLDPGVTLSGVVVNANSEGVLASVWTGDRSTDSTDGGQFTLKGLTPGPHLVQAHTWEASGEANVTAPSQRVRIVLSRKSSISGTVVDEQGQAVAGVNVYGTGKKGVHGTGSFSPSDADGGFRLTGLEDEQYELTAGNDALGIDLEHKTPAKAGDRDVRVVFRAPARATGRVVNAQHVPIGRFAVNGKQLEDVDGRFDVQLKPRDKELRVEALGYRGVEVPLPPDPRGKIAVGDVVLGEGRTLRLHVVGKDTGKPAEGAFVWTAAGWSDSDARGLAVADAAGDAVIQGLTDEALELVVDQGSHRPTHVTIGATETQKTVQLDLGPSISVTIVDSTGQPAWAQLKLFYIDEKESPTNAEVKAGEPWTLEGIPPGRVIVCAWGDSGRATASATIGDSGDVSLTLRLTSGVHVLVDVETPGGRWTVQGLGIIPAEGLDMMHWSSDAWRLADMGDETGTPLQYAFAGLLPGSYQAVVFVGDGARRGWSSTPITISADTTTLHLPAATGDAVHLMPLQ
jgi:hypothetical protein